MTKDNLCPYQRDGVTGGQICVIEPVPVHPDGDKKPFPPSDLRPQCRSLMETKDGFYNWRCQAKGTEAKTCKKDVEEQRTRHGIPRQMHG